VWNSWFIRSNDDRSLNGDAANPISSTSCWTSYQRGDRTHVGQVQPMANADGRAQVITLALGLYRFV